MEKGFGTGLRAKVERKQSGEDEQPRQVPVAVAMVARELPDPIGSEFGIVADEITYGADLETAMRNLSFRVGQEVSVALNYSAHLSGKLFEQPGRIVRIASPRSFSARAIPSSVSDTARCFSSRR